MLELCVSVKASSPEIREKKSQELYNEPVKHSTHRRVEAAESQRAWMNFSYGGEPRQQRQRGRRKFNRSEKKCISWKREEKRIRKKIKTVGSGASVYKIIFQINKIES